MEEGDAENKPLGYPTIRLWELDENSSRYDHFRAAPSDEQMQDMWIVWAVAFALYSFFNFVVLLAILVKKKTRKNAFNQYLLLLMFPDILFTGLCAVTCAVLATHGGYYGSWCKFQSFFLFWTISADTYVNAAIAHEIQRLLQASQRREQYFPPPPRKIFISGCFCYLWGCFVASLGILPISWWLQADSNRGLVCVPLEHDTVSTVLWWLVYFPFSGGIPLAYTTYITFRICYQGLLPPSGRTRDMSIFFFRCYAVLVVMWVPGVAGLFMSARGLWSAYIIGFWVHAVGAATAAVALLKADIRQATTDLLCCRCGEAGNGFSSRSSASFFARKRSVPQETPPSPPPPSPISGSANSFAVMFPSPQLFPYHIDNGFSVAAGVSSSRASMVDKTNTTGLSSAEDPRVGADNIRSSIVEPGNPTMATSVQAERNATATHVRVGDDGEARGLPEE